MTTATQSAQRSGFTGLLLSTIGSLRLSVALLVILGLLTWLGTLAQVGRSLFDVQREYFESWFVFARLPISIWGWAPFDRSLVMPLPGAYPVMALLFVNLVVGGVLRHRWNWRNIGILTTHVGIGLLLVAGFVKMHYSYAGNMALFPAAGGANAIGDRVTRSTTFVSFHDYELALLKPVDATIEERVVPEHVLLKARNGKTVVLQAAGLPFRVEVHHWFDNCEVRQQGGAMEPSAPVVGGRCLFGQPATENREKDLAGCYVRVVPTSGEPIEGIVVGEELRPLTAHRMPLTFTVEGQRYGLDLRRVIYDLPFEVRLNEFIKNDHPGTMIARDFRSKVTVFEPQGEREVQIFMNTPLRKDGFVLYQASFGQAGSPSGDSVVPYTVLEVASNPSDKWPEYACWVIGAGLLVHFVVKLFKFLLSSTRKALAA